MARYGVNVPDSELSSWLSWGPSVTGNPTIEQGATENDSDSLLIAAAFEGTVATMAAASTTGATTLVLQSGEGSQFAASYAKMILVGQVEPARILAAGNNTITISTDPTTTGRGLRYAYPSGTTIERIDLVRYRCCDGLSELENRPALVREDFHSSTNSIWEEMIAADIIKMKVVQSGYGYTLTLEGQCDEAYQTMEYTSKTPTYQTLSLTTEIVPRNHPALLAWEYKP